MDMLAYMLGKQAGGGGGGGGGGDYYRPLLDTELLNELWNGAGSSWTDSGKVQFTTEDSGGATVFYGYPGHTVTVEALDDLDMLGVITLSDYMLEQFDNTIIMQNDVSQGDKFTFTMPYDCVVYMVMY